MIQVHRINMNSPIGERVSIHGESDIWGDANTHLEEWQKQSKFDLLVPYTVVFKDGRKITGIWGLFKKPEEKISLSWHIRYVLEFKAGLKKPKWMPMWFYFWTIDSSKDKASWCMKMLKEYKIP